MVTSNRCDGIYPGPDRSEVDRSSPVATTDRTPHRGGGESGSATCVPELHYEYDVADTAYMGSRYSFGKSKDPSFDSREEARAWIDENCPVD